MHNRERATKLLHSVGLVGATQEDIARTAIALDEAEKRGEAKYIARATLQMPEIVQRPKS